MSGLALLFARQGGPPGAEQTTLVARMMEAIAFRGPDGQRRQATGSVVLGFLALHTTPESGNEVQPALDEAASVAIVFDGRIDNRADLRRQLLDGGAAEVVGDARLALLAYSKWGEHFPSRMTGDFALALWDGRRSLVLCARDPLGARPLVYFEGPRTFLCASELRALLEHPEVPRGPNQGFIGELLLGSTESLVDTVCSGVRRLPPGHTLLVTPEGSRSWSFWRPDPSARIRYPREQEYSEHLFEVLREAVRCRLRSNGPVGAQLSGGLDSSSVVCVAEALRRTGEVDRAPLHVYTMVFPGRACDEEPFARAVIEKTGQPWTRVVPDDFDLREYQTRVARHRDFPGVPNGVMGEGLLRAARADGVRVILTGQGGDQLFLGGSPEHNLARALYQGDVRGAWQDILEGREWSRAIQAVARAVFWSLPERFQRLARRGLSRPAFVPSWVSPALAARTRQRLLGERKVAGASVVSPWGVFALEMEERAAAVAGAEYRHPFLDRRVVELALALPARQVARGTKNRIVLRRALGGWLPPLVAERTSKADFSHTFEGAFESLAGHPLTRCERLRGLGWLRSAPFDGTERRTVPPEQLWPIWMALGIELWLGSAAEVDQT